MSKILEMDACDFLFPEKKKSASGEEYFGKQVDSLSNKCPDIR